MPPELLPLLPVPELPPELLLPLELLPLPAPEPLPLPLLPPEPLPFPDADPLDELPLPDPDDDASALASPFAPPSAGAFWKFAQLTMIAATERPQITLFFTGTSRQGRPNRDQFAA